MNPIGIRTAAVMAGLGSVLMTGESALAGFHLWGINEVYSNSSGTIQFIELRTETGGGENLMNGRKFTSSLAALTLGHDLSGALGARREVPGSAVVRALGELAVDVRGDGLDREVVLPPVRYLDREEAPACTHPATSCNCRSSARAARRRSKELRNAARPRWILLRTVPSFTLSVAPISS